MGKYTNICKTPTLYSEMGSLVTIFGEEKCLEFEKQSGGEGRLVPEPRLFQMRRPKSQKERKPLV